MFAHWTEEILTGVKCTSKKIAALLAGAFALLLTGCGTGSEKEVVSPYPQYDTSAYSFQSSATGSDVPVFSKDLCVIGRENTALDNTHYENVGGAGLFDRNTTDVRYAYNVHEKLYPASTTKILTLYLAVTSGKLDDIVTVSEHAVDQPSDSSVCDLKAGDQITLRDLCYGMMLRSGNDASVAIAEYLGGSVEGFAAMMNQTANALGATNSNFVNPNGLPDENHYTTVYDMYLILNEAIKNEEYLNILTTRDHTASYTNAAGESVTKDWTTTNPYLVGKEEAPAGVTVLGGKTGTTGAAGYCLINLIQNEAGDYLVSTVYKADGRSNLYLVMNEMMGNYAN